MGTAPKHVSSYYGKRVSNSMWKKLNPIFSTIIFNWDLIPIIHTETTLQDIEQQIVGIYYMSSEDAEHSEWETVAADDSSMSSHSRLTRNQIPFMGFSSENTHIQVSFELGE